MDKLSKRMRELRVERNVPQQRLAKAIHVAQSSVFHYENGTTEVPAPVVFKYAEFFDVSLDYLYGRTDDPRGGLYACKSKCDPGMEVFTEICFDPESRMNMRLKDTLKAMMAEMDSSTE